MSSFHLIIASLVHHWRMHVAVASGVVAGTAVLTGALLVGDSMRGSLRDLTLDRLGAIEEVLLSERFFREELAGELMDQPQFVEHFARAVPIILLRSSLNTADLEDPKRAYRVNLLGCDRRFWELDSRPPHGLSRREVVLNEPLAQRLGARVGDPLIARVAGVAAIPAESLLGREEETPEGLRLSVAAIIPAEGLGRFALRPSQQLPLNAYVSMAGLQRVLDRPGRVNAVLVAGKEAAADPPPENHELLEQWLRPEPADYGIRVERIDRGRWSYLNITTARMLFSDAAETEISRNLPSERFQCTFTYLANGIEAWRGDANGQEPGPDQPAIPYSTITALDFAQEPPFGPFRTPEGDPISPLEEADGKRQIVLNQWAADDLGVEPGETICVTYFEPEGTHGRTRQRTARLQLAAVAQLCGPAGDRALTPKVAGVTDKLTMADWDPPFPFDPTRIRPKDEQYWEEYGPTPKAFVSLETGRELWRSRFGETTSIRVRPDETMTVEQLKERLTLDPAAMGFRFQPVKRLGLAASAGTTSFSVLFLAFSFFIIAAAVMLVALLFRLGIERRAAELGILTAVGFTRRRIALLVVAEGLGSATLGSLLGVPAGIGYAALMLLGLRWWWLAAVVTPFLRLHFTWASLIIGFVSGVTAAGLAVVWAVWRTRRIAPRQLLAGRATDEGLQVGRPSPLAGRLGLAMLLVAVALGLVAARLDEAAQAGAFFGAGALVLVASLTLLRARLRSAATGSAMVPGPHGRLLPIAILVACGWTGILLGTCVGIYVAARLPGPEAFRAADWVRVAGVIVGTLVGGGLGGLLGVGLTRRVHLLRMAWRNAARNPGRSTLSIGLVAAACFLIVAVSAFRLDPTQQVPTFSSGNGGFALVAESDQPIYENLNTVAGRSALGFSAEDSAMLADLGAVTYSLRVKPGDDASCLNLYRPQEPRVLGVPKRLIDRGGFAWAGSMPQHQDNPWLLLEEDLGHDADGTPLVPAVIDKNTAAYSLHIGLGDTYEIRDGRGRAVRLKAVGLLSGSLFAGDLLIGEAAFLRLYPEVPGYRFFLTELRRPATSEQTAAVQGVLQRTLADYGLAVETSGQRLARFLVVQNTYLLTFQSLGGLGLLLGTSGLAAVQLRNVLERRAELALLRAAGFRRAALGQLVMLENGLLLFGGLASGVLAALVAALPHLFGPGAMIPWAWLAGTLSAVLVVGLITGLAALPPALGAPVLAALREEA